AFARALANAAEHGLAAVSLRDIVDQLLNDDRLPHARTAEQSDLSALHEWRDQIDDLDARLEDLGLGLEVDEVRTFAMYRPAWRILRNGGTVINRLSDYVQDSA